MSGRKLVNADYNVSTDWKDETESKQILKYGLDNIDWSEMDSALAPVILAGSGVDVAGIFYVFDSDYTIPGTPSAGHNYVRLFESGGVLIGELTAVQYDPFDVLQQGYFEVTGAKRYVLGFTSDGATFDSKYIFDNNNFYAQIDDDYIAAESVNKIQTFKNIHASNNIILALGTSGIFILMLAGQDCVILYNGSDFIRVDRNDILIGHYTATTNPLPDIGIGYKARVTYVLISEQLYLPAGGTFSYSKLDGRDIGDVTSMSALSAIVAGGTLVVSVGSGTNTGILFYERLS